MGSSYVTSGDWGRTRECRGIRRCIGRIYADHHDHPGDVDDLHTYSNVHVDAQLVTVNDHAMPFRAGSSEDGSFTEIGITT